MAKKKYKGTISIRVTEEDVIEVDFENYQLFGNRLVGRIIRELRKQRRFLIRQELINIRKEQSNGRGLEKVVRGSGEDDQREIQSNGGSEQETDRGNDESGGSSNRTGRGLKIITKT